MSRVVYDLSPINALAIQLPAGNSTVALNSLLSSLCGPVTKQINCVKDIAEATLGMVDGGSHPICIVPASTPGPEKDAWGMQWVGVPAVHPQWQRTEVQVAILDMGIKQNHSELVSRITEGYNARAGANPSDYEDDNGHGTHMTDSLHQNRRRLWLRQRDQSSGRACHRGSRAGLAETTGALLRTGE
jgi:Subtilase family